jgi:hypothetical protein
MLDREELPWTRTVQPSTFSPRNRPSHDEFHARWGEEDADAIAGCRVEALDLPLAATSAPETNTVECRLRYCRMADTRADACEAALGARVCVDVTD